ncbi:PLP-dependent aminotransferase family protein [Avibacterium endocarditidis]|uniref:PLP-dependent aminotransferase family protein n=1 Tax=Avibacterium endocarditidis TaxID=380674 RepID=A0ABX4ZRD0_9PAST|nr:PLP-dependent aminotransferase family protein [Avibacterium endocarditidis]POY42056.1 PLP-dependent aminotransferase family protein [Avibacterium endocarditidis]
MKENTKVQQVYDWIVDKIERKIYLPNYKVPSIRSLASKLSCSTFTISQAYDRLVSMGYLNASSGSGYFVCERENHNENIDISSALIKNVLDTGWLMSHLFDELPDDKTSGSGLLPNDWLIDEDTIRNAIRKATKSANEFIYSYGHIQGYPLLRELFIKKLDDIGIKTTKDFVITMPGVSSAIQTVLKCITNEGDYVVVDDPSWFWLLGCLHQLGLKVLSIPRNKDGADLIKLEEILAQYRPKIYITNSVLNNPTSFNVSPSMIYKTLNLLNSYDCYLLEDDVYGELANNQRILRYATLDGLDRVFYITGVSKVLGANWRVGFLCPPKQFLEPILRQKMLSNMTSTELTERSVYHIWLHSEYHKHIEKMKLKLIRKREMIISLLQKLGFDYSEENACGIFIWLDTKCDTQKMATEARKEGYLLAPGYLFSANLHFSTYLRLNITRTTEEFIYWLYQYRLKQKVKIL